MPGSLFAYTTIHGRFVIVIIIAVHLDEKDAYVDMLYSDYVIAKCPLRLFESDVCVYDRIA